MFEIFFFLDFLEERRCILENVGPDLQNMYDSTGLEVSDNDNDSGDLFFSETSKFKRKSSAQSTRERKAVFVDGIQPSDLIE